MKCPNCNKEGCRYEERKPVKTPGVGSKIFKRLNFKAKCKKCGWEGSI